MNDKRGRQDTSDTGSASSRPRDDLRTASKKHKPKDERAEGRDRNLKPERGNKDKE